MYIIAEVKKVLTTINYYDLLLFEFVQGIVARELLLYPSAIAAAKNSSEGSCTQGILPHTLKHDVGIFRPLGHKGPF